MRWPQCVIWIYYYSLKHRAWLTREVIYKHVWKNIARILAALLHCLLKYTAAIAISYGFMTKWSKCITCSCFLRKRLIIIMGIPYLEWRPLYTNRVLFALHFPVTPTPNKESLWKVSKLAKTRPILCHLLSYTRVTLGTCDVKGFYFH